MPESLHMKQERITYEQLQSNAKQIQVQRMKGGLKKETQNPGKVKNNKTSSGKRKPNNTDGHNSLQCKTCKQLKLVITLGSSIK